MTDDLTDEQIGAFHDRMHGDWLSQLDEGHARHLRDGYIRDVRANPEALRQLRQVLAEEATAEEPSVTAPATLDHTDSGGVADDVDD